MSHIEITLTDTHVVDPNRILLVYSVPTMGSDVPHAYVLLDDGRRGRVDKVPEDVAHVVHAAGVPLLKCRCRYVLDLHEPWHAAWVNLSRVTSTETVLGQGAPFEKVELGGRGLYVEVVEPGPESFREALRALSPPAS